MGRSVQLTEYDSGKSLGHVLHLQQTDWLRAQGCSGGTGNGSLQEGSESVMIDESGERGECPENITPILSLIAWRGCQYLAVAVIIAGQRTKFRQWTWMILIAHIVPNQTSVGRRKSSILRSKTSWAG